MGEAIIPEKATRLEVTITVLLGLATVLGAFAAYCAALWGGNQQSYYTQSLAETNRANTIYLEALNDLTAFEMNDFKDDIIYSEWKKNNERNDPDAPYFFSKLSEGLQKDLKDNPSDISEYEKEQSERLAEIDTRFKHSEDTLKSAGNLLQKGQDSNKYGDDFTLCTVLFTIVLFFLGLASLKTKQSQQKAFVIMACVVLLLSIVKMVTVPFPF
jgi:hypothetical protein